MRFGSDQVVSILLNQGILNRYLIKSVSESLDSAALSDYLVRVSILLNQGILNRYRQSKRTPGGCKKPVSILLNQGILNRLLKIWKRYIARPKVSILLNQGILNRFTQTISKYLSPEVSILFNQGILNRLIHLRKMFLNWKKRLNPFQSRYFE